MGCNVLMIKPTYLEKDLEFGQLVTTGNHSKRIYKNRNSVQTTECKCICGKILFIPTRNLLINKTKSCGHGRNRESVNETKHGHSCVDGKKSSLTYNSWHSMRTRCINKQNKDYHKWGGKGIKICERWNSFTNFLEDMGERPGIEYSLDRIDSNKDYSPENCKWSSIKEQNRNRSGLRLITINEITKCIGEWSEISGVHCATITGRLNRNWKPHDAVFTPPLQ